MAFCTILSAALRGLAAEPVQVEADMSNGLPVFLMVGYLSSEVKEAAARVRTAVKNSGIQLPAAKDRGESGARHFAKERSVF